jgi:acyl-CoA dehydrogenase
MTFELDEAHETFRETCRRFVDERVRPVVDDAERAGAFPQHIWKELGDAGLLGLLTPAEFGGDDGDSLAVALLAEELAKASGGLAVTALVSAYMAGPHIVRYGTDAQRQQYLPALAAGSAVAAIAVTEPGVGSNVAGISATAKPVEGGFLLNGRKMFITNAGLADVIVFAAKTSPEAGRRGITTFLVDPKSAGFAVGNPLRKLGWHSSDTREVIVENCFVPADAVLGEPGRGFYQIMEAFQLERIALAAMGLGHAEECLRLATEYARVREVFDTPLLGKQSVAHRLAAMRIELTSARLLTHQAAVRLDAGHPQAAETVAMAKYAGAQTAFRVVDDALQVFGGAGFLEETAVARHYRDVRVLRIGGGTDEIQLEILAKSLT